MGDISSHTDLPFKSIPDALFVDSIMGSCVNSQVLALVLEAIIISSRLKCFPLRVRAGHRMRDHEFWSTLKGFSAHSGKYYSFGPEFVFRTIVPNAFLRKVFVSTCPAAPVLEPMSCKTNSATSPISPFPYQRRFTSSHAPSIV